MLTISANSSRLLAIATLCVYAILLLIGLAANALVGHDGVLRPEAHDLPAGMSAFTILEIQPGSPADRAGLVVGDQVAAVDGAQMGQDDVHQAYHNRRAGQVSVLTVLRGGAEMRVPVVLQSRLAIFGVLSGTISASIVGLLLMGVGATVAFLRPGLLTARLLLLFSVGLATSAAADVWHWTQSSAETADLIDVLAAAARVFASVALLHIFLLFPSPTPAYKRVRSLGPPRLRRAGGAMLLLYALGPVILVVTRLALPAWSWSLLTVLTLVLLLTALASLAYQYTHPTTPLARAQLTWVALALAIAVGAAVLRGFAAAFLPNGIPAGLDALLASTWLLFPLSIGLAEMRYRLFDVGGVARTALIWGVLVAILLAAYALIVVVSARLAVSLLGPGASVDPTIAVVAALAAATAANPVRVRLQRVLERRVYRQRIAREQFLRQAADTLGQPQSPEMLARFLTREAPSTLRLSGGWLALEAPWLARLARSPSGMLPLLSLAPDELLEELAAVKGPLLLAPAEDLDAYAGVPRAAAENELLAPWYAAGARLIVPLRVETALGRATILGLWALGARRDGNVPEREDLAVIQRVAMMAAMQLERLTPRVGDTTGAPAPPVTPDATRSPSLRGPLTPREREVAQLIARGYTNRAIAEALIISERTAEGHAERIRDKLDVRSRAEIAAWASRSDFEDSTETGTVPA